MARVAGQVPTQADKRRSSRLKDRHGREYFAVIEKESGAPTGLVQPLYTPPNPSLVPPQKYMGFPVDKPGFLHIDYDAWLADATQATNEWQQNRAQLIAELPGGQLNPMLPRHLGPPPLNPKVIRAMMQGNKWSLGLTDKKPPEAEEFFPTPAQSDQDAVFTETDASPVFSEEDVDQTVAHVPAGTIASGQSLAELLEDVAKRCPPNLRGGAKQAWCARELERMAAEPVHG